VSVLGQGGDGDIGDVLGIDERFGHLAGGERDLAGQDLVPPVILAEVLREPGGAQDGQLGARGSDGLLGGLGLRLPAAGDEHQARNAALDGELSERAEDLFGPGDREVRVVGDVDGLHTLECMGPGRAVLPIKRRFARARSEPNWDAARREPLGDSATDLSRAALDEYRLCLGVWCHFRFLSIGG
jgi:hypothetical protein